MGSRGKGMSTRQEEQLLNKHAARDVPSYGVGRKERASEPMNVQSAEQRRDADEDDAARVDGTHILSSRTRQCRVSAERAGS
jgi:hypothetical protein